MLRSRLAFLCLPVLAGLVLAAPAGAYVTAPSRPSSGTASGATQFNLSSLCNEGQTAIGGGGELKGDTFKAPDPDVGFNQLNLTNLQDGYTAGATTTKGSADTFLITYAFCAFVDASQPEGGANGGGYVRGVEIVHTQSPFDSTDSKVIKATCPSNKVLIGGGGGDVDAPASIVIYKAAPSGNTWVVRAHESTPIAGTWQVESKAICASVTDTSNKENFVDGVEYITQNGAFGSETVQKSVVTCPQGKKIIGGAGQIISEGDVPRQVIISRNQPRGDEKTATQWATEGTELVPTSADWSVRTTAVCANIKQSASPGF